MELRELKNSELFETEGGAPLWWVFMGGAIAVATAVNTVYDSGKNLGEFVYTVTH